MVKSPAVASCQTALAMVAALGILAAMPISTAPAEPDVVKSPDVVSFHTAVAIAAAVGGVPV